MYIDPFIIFNLTGIAAGLLAFFVTTKRTEKKITYARFLALLVLYMGLSYTCLLVKLMYGFDFSPFIVLLGPPLFFIYYYSRLHLSTSPMLFLHFIPACLYIVYLAGMKLFSPNPLHCFTCYLSEACLAYICFYFLLAMLEYYKARKRKADERTLATIKKMFLPNLLFLFALIFMFFRYRAYSFDYFFLYYLSLAIFFTSYAIIKDTILLSGSHPEKKYSKSSLDDSLKQMILKKIEHKMEAEKYYTSGTASLPDLARKIGTTPNNVSQVINECLGKPFFELLAGYRIAEAKRIITENKTELSIEAVAGMVGYNSKSAFYSAFRKITGITPSEYRNMILQIP